MKAMIKNKLFVALALAATLFASYSCEDNDYLEIPVEVNKYPTILEVLQKEADCSEFLQVVELCGVGCPDSLFNQSRVYTVFAPVNGSFDISAIEERLARGDREGVFKEYVKSHIANFRHTTGGDLAENNELLMLSDKYVAFSGNEADGFTFGGKELLETNIYARNGLVHKIAARFDYKPSIWESFKNINSISSFWDFCFSFTEKEFDPYNSILGDIVDQEQTYRDSAFNETNSMLNLMGSINNEDSLMIMYAPSNELWDAIYNDAYTFFNYDTEEFTVKQKAEADSIAKLRGVKSYMKYFAYSLSDQRVNGAMTDFDNLPDSLAVREVGYPRKKYPTAEFSVVETYDMSNGKLMVVDAMPINPFNLWVDTIRIEPDTEKSLGVFHNVRKDKDDNQQLNTKATYSAVAVSEKEQNPDVEGKLSNGRYFLAAQADKSKPGELPRVTFFVKGVLSTNYKIALITPPWFIKSYNDTVVKNTTLPQYKDSYLRVRVRQKNELLAIIPSDSVNTGTDRKPEWSVLKEKAIVPDRSRIDTIFLKDEEGNDFIFNFKYCEDFSQLTELKVEEEDYTVEVDIELLRPAEPKTPGKPERGYKAVSNNNFSYRFLLDQIMLIPVEDAAEEESNAGN